MLRYMVPAVAWDGDAVAWSVMGRLRARQWVAANNAARARERVAHRPARVVEMLTATSQPRNYPEFAQAAWKGEWLVIALLFAHPDSEAVRQWSARADYFDLRTGSTWDLFVPGYYRLTGYSATRVAVDGHRVSGQGPDSLYFSPRGFDDLRRHVQEQTGNRWQYSGEADLVLLSAWLPESGDPTVDWQSVLAGQISDSPSGQRTLTLAQVIERISVDLEQVHESESFGVPEVVRASLQPGQSVTREILVQAIANVGAALGLRVLGL